MIGFRRIRLSALATASPAALLGSPPAVRLVRVRRLPRRGRLYTEQVNEMNPRVRQRILHKMQQLIHERAMFGPVMEPAFLNGVGPRLDVHGLGLVANHAYSAPYEDLRLKKR